MKRLAIFAGYDKDNIIDDYVLFYLKELNKLADIIYVADCEMPETELNKVKDYTIKAISERHGEYDFGSYKRGYIYAKENNILETYDYLILCNDSVYGPFFNFKEIVENMESKNTDVWGIFRCMKDKENDEHLQSYFISMTKNVFMSKEYSNFIMSVKKEKDKWKIVKKYEIGLSILFENLKFTISSYLDSSIKGDNGDNNNVPFFNILKAIENGFPFFKITVFKEILFVKLHVNDLRKIFGYIKSYDRNLIIKHLNRVIEKDKIKYLFPRFKKFNINIANKKFINILSKYSVSGKYQIVFKLFNKLSLTIDFPKGISYIDYGYKNFDFLNEL